MTTQKVKLKAIVRLKWKDSAFLRGWVIDESLPESGTQTAAGIVVGSTEDDLVIAPAVNDEFSYINPMAIPWVSVVELEVLGGAD